MLFYLVVYSVANLGAFAVAAWLSATRARTRSRTSTASGSDIRSWPSASLLLMLSLIGLPPLAGFFGKLFMFWRP